MHFQINTQVIELEFLVSRNLIKQCIVGMDILSRISYTHELIKAFQVVCEKSERCLNRKMNFKESKKYDYELRKMIRKAVFEKKLSKRRNYEETPDDEEEQMIENEEVTENEVPIKNEETEKIEIMEEDKSDIDEKNQIMDDEKKPNEEINELEILEVNDEYLLAIDISDNKPAIEWNDEDLAIVIKQEIDSISSKGLSSITQTHSISHEIKVIDESKPVTHAPRKHRLQ